MTRTAARLSEFVGSSGRLVLVEVDGVKGSTPRETGAWMLVSNDRIFGTIGGGQLEFRAIDHARAMLAGTTGDKTLALPLGPEIGQCCGGHVEIGFTAVDDAVSAQLAARARRDESEQAEILVFGAGHVGRALAGALAPLPFRTTIIETRAGQLDGLDNLVDTRLTPIPEEMIAAAGPGTAYVVLTHDHALDFLLVRAALERRNAAYVGMIGSKTKRVTYEHWHVREGGDAALLPGLVSPIGGDTVHDKRPEIIAALVAAELIAALSAKDSDG